MTDENIADRTAGHTAEKVLERMMGFDLPRGATR